ncbi:hypothetical protein [Nocardia pseudovaccinii]|uniref:hypothetical protein n=1 Tax=Nocardia pseudovaccinii TaxID=189540 RepID=UPI0007A39453|nr:hypothetical protein [Nocardia pseudovaccinii]
MKHDIETAPAATSPVLGHAARSLYKATLVPLEIETPMVGQAITKQGFLNQLALTPEEIDSAAGMATTALSPGEGEPAAQLPRPLLADFARREPGLAPDVHALAEVPLERLRAFGQAVVSLRRDRVQQDPSGEASRALHRALVAVKGLEVNTSVPRFGMMNLERLEMSPAGIERGELIATIPLAPQEETAVTQKEWSVTHKEFTSIVTDSLENLSETGVTDNTELAQSTTSQQEHANQFNITGTVQGGIPVISGSVTSSYGGQGKESQSATESRKHATALTQKASTRSKQEHKVTISTTTVTGTEQTTTRKLKNPSSTAPIRIDYFSMMRKWQVRLYRYGLRATYDIVLPEPAASLRAAYTELDWLKKQQGPFVFNVLHDDISDALVEVGKDSAGNPIYKPKYVLLGEQYGVFLPAPKSPTAEQFVQDNFRGADDDGDTGWFFKEVPFNLNDPDYEIDNIALQVMLGYVGHDRRFYVYGTAGNQDVHGDDVGKTFDLKDLWNPAAPFMQGARGPQKFTFFYSGFSQGQAYFKLNLRRTEETHDRWVGDVWNALHNAAQARYYAAQQDIANRITALEDKLNGVDTLTLRRGENDEIMKGVLRYLLGGKFPTMPADVAKAFADAKVDLAHGTAFDSGVVGPDSALWSVVQQYEDRVRFVNQAIEWENVTTFLYSYFWDLPESWPFIRDIEHPDPNRQAFLRAGSARVVLTIRKGWETRWANFVERGLIDDPNDPGDSVHWSIAQEIAAYDDRNYPGIAPANPGKNAARLQDAVFANCSTVIGPSAGPVSIPVDTSAGFVVGAKVVIDVVDGLDHRQEVQTVTAVPVDGRHIVVGALDKAHTGTAATPFPIVQPGEKGELIAEWNEYTPSSGTDIAVTSDLTEIA